MFLIINTYYYLTWLIWWFKCSTWI